MISLETLEKKVGDPYLATIIIGKRARDLKETNALIEPRSRNNVTQAAKELDRGLISWREKE